MASRQTMRQIYGTIHRGLVVGLITIIYAIQRATGTGEVQDVCLMEQFEARCPEDNVVVMASALYGRMRTGRCAPAHSGNLGCFADVLSYFDDRCSGRRSCTVNIPNDDLFNLKVCKTGDFPYLEAAYNCVPVIGGADVRQSCLRDGIITVFGRLEGIIASSMVFSNSYTSSTCPWIIRAQPGQRINVTMMDFGRAHMDMANSVEYRATCNRYAILQERSLASPTTVCSGIQRERNIYFSKSHELEIEFVDTEGTGMTSNFLFKFKIQGCPNPPLNGSVLRERTPSKAVLHCESNGQIWNLFCHGTEWNAHSEYCPPPPESETDDWLSSTGLAIIVVIGLALGTVIGLVLLLLAHVCMSRRRKRKLAKQNVYYEDDSVSMGLKFTTQEPSIKDPDYDTFYRRNMNDGRYAHVWNPVNRDVIIVETVEPPGGQSTENEPSTDTPSTTQQPNKNPSKRTIDHIYERPL